MISVQKLNNALVEIKDITKLELALFDLNGKAVAATNGFSEDVESVAVSFAETEAQEQIYRNIRLYKLVVEHEVLYILGLEGEVDNVAVIAQMAICQLRNLILSQEEGFDRNNFIQNVLLGNLLTTDMYAKAKRLHIEAKPRVAFVIDTGHKSTDMVMELVKNMSDMKSGDFVTSIDEHSVVLLKDVSHVGEEDREEELADIADSLVDNLHMEAMVKVRVGYGNVVTHLAEMAQSYQEAKMALQVGKVFYASLDTISYGKLGIGRLIYQLPMNLCEMFIKEIFGECIPEILDDEEAMSTIQKFFENNLNISETARQLYVHRNTLVYRLERIEKEIGLDIRKFDDAMTFRIAVMVLAHMKDQKQM